MMKSALSYCVISREVAPFSGVVTGLDPVIHPLRKLLMKIDGSPG
jgi:hypothetical protein